MMSKQTIPPLRDLPPGRLAQRTEHLLGEIRGESGLHLRRAALAHPSLRAFILVGAGCAAAAAIAFLALTLGGSMTRQTPLGGSTRPHTPLVPRGHAPAYRPIALQFVRSGGALASIHVVVQAPIRNAVVRLQVLRGLRARAVVFRQSAHLSNIASPRPGPPGTEALARWSAVLLPSQWNGGCEHARYTVAISVSRSGLPSQGAALVIEAPPFRCDRK
jgi:hypothetical protein